jgi:PKD repeat protein
MKKQFLKATSALLASAMLFTASCKKPAASFTADKTTVAVGQAVTFTNTSKDDAKVAWDFGDGTESDAITKTVTHVYEKPGSYTVNLLVSKGNDKKPSDATPVTITVSGPTASFTASTTSPLKGQVVTFTSTSTNASSFAWDFGDGSSNIPLTTPTVSHTYNNGGTYVVTLTVKDPSNTVVSNSTMTVTVGGVGAGSVDNQLLIVGTWKYVSRVATDVRNGTAYTTTSTANGNSGLGLSYSIANTVPANDMQQFTGGGSIYNTDPNGNVTSWGSYNILDATKISGTNYSSVNAYNTNSQAYATYTVSASSLVITFVSTATLPAYTDYATPSTVGNTNYSYTSHAAGETQVVTTTYTYSK